MYDLLVISIWVFKFRFFLTRASTVTSFTASTWLYSVTSIFLSPRNKIVLSLYPWQVKVTKSPLEVSILNRPLMSDMLLTFLGSLLFTIVTPRMGLPAWRSEERRVGK